ncbi:MAG: hypothetical protein LBH12_00290 [Dysgonamonadaceae bacterium]|nr:hypothetical protein [Dysgonamonadaceae bacterium]
MYSKNYIYAEDYFLWSQIASKYSVANLFEVLILYREHSGSVSMQKENQQIETTKKILAYHLAKLNIQPTKEELDLHYLLVWKPSGIDILNRKERKKISAWVEKLKLQNEKYQIYDREYFNRKLNSRWSWEKKFHIVFLHLKSYFKN